MHGSDRGRAYNFVCMFWRCDDKHSAEQEASLDRSASCGARRCL